MVRRRRFLDVIPDAQAATSAQMTQVDRWSDATITGQEDSTRVSAHLEGSSQPDVVVPSDSGVSAVGARVRAFRDSTGRVTHVSIPDVIPEGAATFTVGVTGERLVQLDATQVDQGAQIERVEAGLDSARVELSAAMERLNDPDTGLDATQQKADAAATAAGTAQSTANAKSKTFTSTPTVPYSVGDLWRNGNKVYICTTARATGSYTASDWTLTADKTSENTAADTSKVGGTASATVIQNIATALANGKPFIQQATPSATAVGQLWFPTDSSGRVIGMKVSTATGTGSWQTYLMMAGQILVPGSVGTTEIGPEGVTAANIKASNELWAKIATFAKVTTDMLTAGNAVITGDLLADVITGIILRGGLFEAGGGSLPMIRVGPLSGTPGSGDAYGVYLTTPNSNANGSASLEVTPAGPAFSMLNGSGTTLLSMDSVDGLKVKDYDSDSVISVSQMILNSYSVTETSDITGNKVTTSNGAWSWWRDMATLGGATDAAGAIKVMTPTGRFQVTLQAGFTDTAANDFYLGQVNVNFGTSPHADDINTGFVASTPLSATFQPKNSEAVSTLLSYPFVGTVSVPANTQLYVWFSFRSLHVSVTNGYGHCNYRAITIKPI